MVHKADWSHMAEQDLVERTRKELRQRLKELDPLVEERDRIRAGLEALESSNGQGARLKTGGGARRRRGSSGRAGRGQRRDQLLKTLRDEPGLRPSDAARRLGMQPSQLHSLAKKLEGEGAVEKREGALYARKG